MSFAVRLHARRNNEDGLKSGSITTLKERPFGAPESLDLTMGPTAAGAWLSMQLLQKRKVVPVRGLSAVSGARLHRLGTSGHAVRIERSWRI